MLYTLMLPDEGQILVDGIDAVADPQGARFALGVLPDQSGLYPRLTAREHIEYFGELQGVTGADLRSRTDHLLKMLDMTAIADRRVAGFSHGERTKTALARAIRPQPEERAARRADPSASTLMTRARSARSYRRAQREGHTVLSRVTSCRKVSALCDTIIVIARGRIVRLRIADDLRRRRGTKNLDDSFVALSGA
jgi:sodium transport system ATP-binding protein